MIWLASIALTVALFFALWRSTATWKYAALLRFARAFLAPPRVIMDREGGTPYLSRWYLVGKQPEVNRHGNPTTKGSDTSWQVLLHRFHRGDHDGELHSHPWRWSIAIVLAGGYIEERRVGDKVVIRWCLPGTINVIAAEDFHRVDLVGSESWSIFITGPKVASWFFWCRERLARAPWRAFLAWKQDGAAEPAWMRDVRGDS